jgi:hypothetical protein
MSGYETILKIRRLEKECDDLGFMLCRSKYGHGRIDGLDVLALKPKDEASLPVYSRDAELFHGSIADLEVWLRGIQWARQYDRFLFGVKHDRARERKEVDERARQVAAVLKKGVES